MKCPKCNYLGFETGDRCKNCGYDFSLIESPPVVELDDLTLNAAGDDGLDRPAWIDQMDGGLRLDDFALPASEVSEPLRTEPAPVAAAAPLVKGSQRARAAARVGAEPPLPLFVRDGDGEDAPLIKVPSAPRPPLAVRRTPETPRLRAVARPRSRVSREPALEFVREPPGSGQSPAVHQQPRGDTVSASVAEAAGGFAAAASRGARLAAVALDHGLLLAVDAAVVYFTLRIAALPFDDWRLLPAPPLLAFLLLLKLSYFCAFTAVGGQTIGKMAARIRVVTDAGAPVDGARAVRRTMAGAVSAFAFGAGFIPALIDSERRALHDRVAHTRVVGRRSA
jgi:uncharacterized RDD family membrane protein YckC